MRRAAVRPIHRVLIANRGEIAVRIARACAEMGIESVAAASTADAASLHARSAREVVILGPAPPAESYLDIARVVAAARERRCDAVHPGYGFLAENPAFAEAVEGAGLVFIGPPPAAMRAMGDKVAARRAMERAGLPILPGHAGRGRAIGAAELSRAADRLQYPLLIKAAAGGGGRGIRIVRSAQDLDEAIEGARREAEGAFGDGRVLLERFIEDARHIEVQILADRHGGCIHLFERDCSVQRRFQKMVEESPSPFVDDALRARLGEAAVKAARACGYVGAGTVEFLVAPDRAFYFLEMNTRIQVEHPVTEMVTGVDLVQAQLRIAAGEPLPVRQETLRLQGHALECRITAEDPALGFAPSAGPILHAVFAAGDGIRVDAGVETGDVVGVHYDSLLAKTIVHAADRGAAILGMERALAGTVLLGVATNLPYLRAVLAHPAFREGRATTAFVGREMTAWKPRGTEVPDSALIAAALAEALAAPVLRGARGGAAPGPTPTGSLDPWARDDRFRPGGG